MVRPSTTNWLDPKSRIKSQADYEDFIRWLLVNKHINFHPDNPFEDYADETGTQTFSSDESAILNARMKEAFHLLKHSIYDIGLVIFRKYTNQARVFTVSVSGDLGLKHFTVSTDKPGVHGEQEAKEIARMEYNMLLDKSKRETKAETLKEIDVVRKP